MQKSIRLFFSSFFLLFSIALYSQTDSIVRRIIDIGNSDNQTMHHQDVLCNRFGGRLVGSAAFTDAANWAAHKFKEWGMEVIMDEAGEVPVLSLIHISEPTRPY